MENEVGVAGVDEKWEFERRVADRVGRVGFQICVSPKTNVIGVVVQTESGILSLAARHIWDLRP